VENCGLQGKQPSGFPSGFLGQRDHVLLLRRQSGLRFGHQTWMEKLHKNYRRKRSNKQVEAPVSFLERQCKQLWIPKKKCHQIRGKDYPATGQVTVALEFNPLFGYIHWWILIFPMKIPMKIGGESSILRRTPPMLPRTTQVEYWDFTNRCLNSELRSHIWLHLQLSIVYLFS